MSQPRISRNAGSIGRIYPAIAAILTLVLGAIAIPSDAHAEGTSVSATNYAELRSAMQDPAVGTVSIAGPIPFAGTIAVNGAKTIIADQDAGGAVSHDDDTDDFPLFQVGDGATLTVGTADDGQALAYSEQGNGRFATVAKGGALTIDNGTFSDNANASGDAAVVLVEAGGTLSVNGGEFSGNTSSASSPNTGGGAIHSSGTVTVNGGTFAGNTTGRNDESNLGYHGGGAIWSDGTLTINDGTFTGNISRAQHYWASGKLPTGGGAIWATRSLTVNGGTFTGNWQKDGNSTLYGTGGGAIYFGDGTKGSDANGTLTINGGTFTGNRSMQDGGAIFMTWNTTGHFRSGSFTDNWSNRLGGAVYTEEDSISYINNAAMFGNMAGHFGGGLWLCPSGQGMTSEHGGMALFGNIADQAYDRAEDGTDTDRFPTDKQDGKTYTNTATSYRYGSAGDDLSIMYPNKSGSTQSSFELTSGLFTGERTTWYEDGEPSSNANGFLYDAGSLSVNAAGRYADGDAPRSNQDETLKPGNAGHGYGLKSIPDAAAKDRAKAEADLTFTGNRARLSGGAFGSNGIVRFVHLGAAGWKKADADGTLLAGSAWRINGPGPYDPAGTIPLCAVDEQGDAQASTNAWCRLADGSATAIVEDNGGLDRSPDDGVFLLRDLTAGTYTLVETRAPEHHRISHKTYRLTVDDKGGQELAVADGGEDGTGRLDGSTIINDLYGGVSWSKVDADDATVPLDGSAWQLQDADGRKLADITDCVDATRCAPTDDDSQADLRDSDPAPGRFALRYLSAGTYRLVETKAPQGYEKSETTYTFTIDASHHTDVAILDGNGTAVKGNALPNARSTGSMVWHKIDADGEGRLAGSEWQLVRITNRKGEDIAENQRKPVTVTDCIVDGRNAVCGKDSIDRDPSAGGFRVEGLDWGTYRLTETKAPRGYELPDGTTTFYTFEIGRSNFTEHGFVIPKLHKGDGSGDTVDGGDITNTPIRVSALPVTGGTGNGTRTSLPYAAIVLSAASIIIAAAIAAGRRLRGR